VNGTITFPNFGPHRKGGPNGDGSTPPTTAPSTPTTTTG
jgi:hypothetical protein